MIQFHEDHFTYPVISHPDAGKSTLTEALVLHAHVISEVGATHGKTGRKTTVSDWIAAQFVPQAREFRAYCSRPSYSFVGRILVASFCEI